MNKKVQKQWVKALLSGKYKQGTAGLHTQDKFCCLGVLCDLHRIETNGPDWEGGFVSQYLDRGGFSPIEVLSWAGLRDTDQRRLADLNDNEITFPEIAYVIKEL